MRTLRALVLLCAPAVIAPVPKELRNPPPVINEYEKDEPFSEILRHFWFADQPSHLTPERIYGGILP